MARADSPNITTTSAPSRRGLLQGAAATIVASSVAADGALAGESLSSPEFAEWQRLAMKTRDWFAWCQSRDVVSVVEEQEADIGGLWDRMHELETAIFKKPVRSIADVMVLGVIAFFWNVEEGPGALFFDGKILGLQPPDDSTDDKTRGYLIRAVCMLAQATGQIPVLANSNFDLPSNA